MMDFGWSEGQWTYKEKTTMSSKYVPNDQGNNLSIDSQKNTQNQSRQ